MEGYSYEKGCTQWGVITADPLQCSGQTLYLHIEYSLRPSVTNYSQGLAEGMNQFNNIVVAYL